MAASRIFGNRKPFPGLKLRPSFILSMCSRKFGKTVEQKEQDAGTIAMLMKRFVDYRLPRAQRMLEKVNAGERITDHDLYWLKNIFADSTRTLPLVKRNPEYTSLVAGFLDMYTEITTKAIENEKAGK